MKKHESHSDVENEWEKDPLLQIPGKKKFPPYRPIAYFGCNLLLGGLGYVLLRQYRRFYALLLLIMIAALIPMIGTLLDYAIMFGSCFDAYLIARRYRDSSLPEPAYNRMHAYIAFGIWIISFILVISSVVLIAQNPAVAN